VPSSSTSRSKPQSAASTSTNFYGVSNGADVPLPIVIEEMEGECWTTFDDASFSSRNGHAIVARKDGSVLVFGGFNGNKYENDVWRFTRNTGAAGSGDGEWHLYHRAVWSARSGHQVVLLLDGMSVLLSGGFNGSDCLNDVFVLLDFEMVAEGQKKDARLKMDALQAKREASGAFQRKERNAIEDMKRRAAIEAISVKPWHYLGNAPWSPRCNHAIALVGDSLILCGGVGSKLVCEYNKDAWQCEALGWESRYANEKEAQVRPRRTWTKLETPPWSAREGHALVSLPDGSMLLIGGHTLDPGVPQGRLGDIWRYNPEEKIWAHMGKTPFEGRTHHHALGCPDGKVLILGGTGANGGPNPPTEVWKYNPPKRIWQCYGEMPQKGRICKAAVMQGGKPDTFSVIAVGTMGKHGRWCISSRTKHIGNSVLMFQDTAKVSPRSKSDDKKIGVGGGNKISPRAGEDLEEL